jgi:DNA-binding GntR family transcriptional regulator
VARTKNGDRSRADVVFEALRADLIEGRIEPGERLKLPALVERFGVSMTVIREALTRLAEQHMVVAVPNRGFSVMSLSVEDLKDLTHLRLRLETMVLRDSIEHGELAWETRVVAAHHALNRTPYLDDKGELNAAKMSAHRDFHHALGSGCGSPRLIELVDNLRDSAELYRAWSRSIAHDHERDVTAEHDEIVRAALAHDTDAASAALRDHIERSTAVLLRHAGAQAPVGT